jgi:two-component system chemotaxis sensor kinase CheA
MAVGDESLAALFEQYKDEVRETIETLDSELVAIEQDPTNSEMIFSIFRNLHSLKGSSKMFNVDNIGHIAHKLEDLMAIIDQDNSILEKHPKVVDLLFKGNDIFRDVIARLETDITYTNLTPEHARFIEQINQQLDAINRRENVLIDSAQNLLDDLKTLLPALDETDADNLRRSMEDLASALSLAMLTDAQSGKTYKYGDTDVTRFVVAFENGLEKFRSQSFETADVTAFFQNAEEMIQALFEVAEEDIMGVLSELNDGLEMYEAKSLEIDAIVVEFFNAVLEDLKAKLKTEAEGGGAETEAAPAEAVEAEATVAPARRQTAAPTGQAKTIRVDEKKIDHFLDSVGRLITQSEILNHLQYSFKGAGVNPALIRDFASVNRTISNDIIALQRSIMEVRQVEMDNILKKFPRLVRDISHKMDKDVELVISGERIPIDKSLLDDVEAAMIHIVRNAIDHGLEKPDERVTAGKNRRGRISVGVVQEEASILVEIADDGRGIDFGRVKRKALDRGWITREEFEHFTDQDAERLIYQSGLTTKDEATDISGRGVGLDVVRSNVRKWNGEVSLENHPGRGLTIRLRIPITNTLLTKEAIVLRLSDDVFCLPLENVVEIVNVPIKDVHRHKERSVFKHRNRVIGVLDLKKLLMLPQNETGRDFKTFVILRGKNGAQRSISADELLGQQKIVIKEFEIEAFRKIPYFQGLTLMGDGRVVLVLDAEQVVDQG